MNIGIIGLSYMGLHHLKIMRKLLADDLVKAHILHVCDLDEARLNATAEKYGIPRATTTPEALVGDADLDAVVIATPWSTHGTWPAGRSRRERPSSVRNPWVPPWTRSRRWSRRPGAWTC